VARAVRGLGVTDALAPVIDRLVEEARACQRQGRLEESLSLAQAALAQRPDCAAALHLVGIVALARGQWPEAVGWIARALMRDPDCAEGHNDLGVGLAGWGKPAEALAAFETALSLRPDYADAYNNLGLALRDLGHVDEAIDAFGAALSIAPYLAPAHNNLGIVLRAAGRTEQAVSAYRMALSLRPDYPEAQNNLGNALAELERWDEADAAYRMALSLRPDYGDARYNLGNLLMRTGRLDEAILAYRAALAPTVENPDRALQLGRTLMVAGRMADAHAVLRAAVARHPEAGPDLHLALGETLAELGRRDEAAAAYRAALARDPGLARIHLALGQLLEESGVAGAAIVALSQAHALAPDSALTLSHLCRQRQQVCDWDGLEAECARLLDLVRAGERVPPFAVLALPGATAQDQRDCARVWARGLDVVPLPPDGASVRARGPDRPIRIGYLSADFHDHATAYLTAGVFERHDRARFAIAGYSLGPDDGGTMRRRLAAAFDDFVDLSSLGHAEAARRIRADGIDILVDLKGYTRNARTEIVAARPAPVQVAWLGYPGTLGADFIDYALVDSVVAPPEEAALFVERPVFLPHCYQCTDDRRPIARDAPSRADCGLPPTGVVLCCFNNTYKIAEPVFSVWMRVLRAVPDAVLWLLETGPGVADALRRAATARGVAAARLVFAPRISQADHLARHRLADLALDTLPYCAHTTASDALWAGVPLATCRGDTFPGRVAASVLRAAEMPGLIAATLAEYEEMLVRLATDRAELAAARARLAALRAEAPLFDTGGFTRALEAAFIHMANLSRGGHAPRSFSVGPDGRVTDTRSASS
jgi:protein O-GlcNAc transferase